jgi:hypothetical protein
MTKTPSCFLTEMPRRNVTVKKQEGVFVISYLKTKQMLEKSADGIEESAEASTDAGESASARL